MNKRVVAFFGVGVILLVLVASNFLLTKDTGKSQETVNTSQDKEEIKDYSLVDKGVGFLSRNGFEEDLKIANEVGLVFLNAKHETGKIPEIIRIGFEEDYLDYPVPNMAGSAKNPEQIEKAYLELVTKYNPYYIGLGNEIERMPDKNEFVLVYNDLYDKIKEKCGDCVVYPVFQYESFEPDLAKKFKMDLLVLTSYPFIKYLDINDIPDDYYSQANKIASEKGVAIAFTEIGWTTLANFQSGEEYPQVAFYNKFKEITEDLDVAFVGWGLLYGAPEIGKEWNDMGLLNRDGSKKLVFEEFTK